MNKRLSRLYLPLLMLLSVAACKSKDAVRPPAMPGTDSTFSQLVRVVIVGYTGNAMEPFLSRDGDTLLFNNLNAAPENTNLHWATRLTDTTFQYQGQLTGVNTPNLEGVPTLDTAGNLYFVSTRDYATTLSTLYQGRFANGAVTGVQLVGGVSHHEGGWVNFDVEVSADGQTLYFVDARLDGNGVTQSADLVIAAKTGSSFTRLPNTGDLLKNVNSSDFEYAACISANQLELYFTRVAFPLTASSSPEILVSTRTSVTEAFSLPSKITAITGFAEAATVAPDQRTIYYHKKGDDGLFGIYLIRKK